VRKLFFIILLVIFYNVSAQQAVNIDSLYSITTSGVHDSDIAIAHVKIARELTNSGSYDEAFKHHSIALELRKKIGDLVSVSKSLNSLGVVSRAQGDYQKAMGYYFKSLKIAEKTADKKRQAMVISNIGVVYMRQKDFEKALEYFYKALALDKTTKNLKGQAYDYGNIGILYSDLQERDSAIYYNKKAQFLLKELGDENAMIQVYNVIGGLYFVDKNLDSARYYYNLGLEIADRLNLKEQQVLSTLQVAHTYWKVGEPDKAIILCEEALKKAEKLGNKRMIQSSCDCISLAAEVKGDIQKAYDYYVKVVDLDREIYNRENDKKFARIELKHEYIKKEEEILALKEKSEAIAKEKQKRQQIIIVAVVFGLLLLSIFFVLLYKRFKVTQQQKTLIEAKEKETQEQKLLVEEKNKEITDSITYAKQIQEAILPTTKLVKEWLPNSFIFYQPKDIVAGDFYWMDQQGDNILFAAADCTGHGVPGAMVSVVCCNAMNRVIRDYNLLDPGEILDKTRELVVEQLNKSENPDIVSMDNIRDGMDIAFCILNTKTNELKYAGAYNPLWILRNAADEIEEIKANKQAIGKVDNPLPFTTHQVQLNKGDSIYIFSDGFADQFGGEKGKKLKYKPFKQLLISMKNETMENQLKKLNNHFETWKGNLEQVDDVCVIGVKI